MQDLPGSEQAFMGVGPGEVEVELVERGLGEEVGAAGKRLDVEELIFDEAMDGLDIALIGMRGRRDALVLGAEESNGAREAIAGTVGPQRADELAAVVGMPGQVLQIDAAALEMGLNALGKQLTGTLGAALREG